MFLNIHTHKEIVDAEVKSIINLIVPTNEEDFDSFFENIDETKSYSIGVHPWYLNPQQIESQLEVVRVLSKYPSIKIIGECGLDRLRGENLALQEEVFIQQIRIAEEVRKPIIIHCVRCFNELLSIKKVIRPKIPLIVHGFNSNIEIAQQLLHKDFYFSLGSAILDEKSNAYQLLQQISINRLFLETDDTELNIKQLYEFVATTKGISVNQLSEEIFNNYIELYLD